MESARLSVILSHLVPNLLKNDSSLVTDLSMRLTSNDIQHVTKNNCHNSSLPHGSSLNKNLIQNLNDILENGKYREKEDLYNKYFHNNSIFVRESDSFDLTTKQKKELTVRKFIQMMRDLGSIGWENHERIDWYLDYIALSDPSLLTLYGAHYVLFGGALDKQAHESLRSKYFEKSRSLEILGCYCMTEMSHGSYIRGMQTTADYDPETEEFIIDTPGPNAMKFWIGNAGFDATHGIVFARLRTDGKDFGIHLFLVPLRNMENHLPLPGVIIGDIGEKQGRNGISNGYVLFKNVRIPRENMLMKWSKVSKEGSYIPSPNPALSYGALIEGRARICITSVWELKRAITIAIRYAHTRRQFHNIVSNEQNPREETQLISYQSHQSILLPHLANAYTQNIASFEIMEQYRELCKDLDRASKDKTPIDTQLIADVHNLVAGMKACFTEQTAKALLDCRQSLGGHGYSAYSGYPKYYNDFIASSTFEGDNKVLLQQTARQLLKSFTKVLQGSEIKGKLSFLMDFKTVLSTKCKAREFVDFLDPNLLIEALQYRCLKCTSVCTKQVKNYIATTNSDAIAWNRSQYNLIEAAKSYIEYYCGKSFFNHIKKVTNPQCKTALTSLFNLYAMNIIHGDIATLISEEGYINSNQVPMIRAAFLHICEEVKLDSMNYCEAFAIRDDLMPPLGKSDCRIYENLFEKVQSIPGHNERAPYYEELIKPLMNQNARK